MREERRRVRLAVLIERLDSGKDVAVRDLKIALTTAEYEIYEQRCADAKSVAAYMLDKPEEVTEYEGLLKKATLLYNRAEGYASRGALNSEGKMAAPAMYNKAEAAFERALERLEELVGFEPTLREWFDRELDFTANGMLGPSVGAMPIAKTSVSTDNMKSGSRRMLQNKRALKKDALESALQELDAVHRAAMAAQAEAAIERTGALREFMRRRK